MKGDGTMAKGTGYLEWHGQRHTKDEWARLLGLSRQGLELRLKTMPYDKVFSMPRRGVNLRSMCTYPDCYHCPLPDCYVDEPQKMAMGV